MTDMTESADVDVVVDAAIRDAVSARETPVLVTVEEAARLADVSVRTIRRWIQHGHLPHVEDENGKRVSPGDLPIARERAGRGQRRGQGRPTPRHDRRPDTAETDTDTARIAPPVSSSATAQMEAIRDQWLRPLIDRIEELSRENGRLEAERNQVAQERDALRAELAAARVSHEDAPVRRGASPWVWEAIRDVPDIREPIWRRLGRRLRGG